MSALDLLKACEPWGRDCDSYDGMCCADHRRRRAQRKVALDALRETVGPHGASVQGLRAAGLHAEADLLAAWWTAADWRGGQRRAEEEAHDGL